MTYLNLSLPLRHSRSTLAVAALAALSALALDARAQQAPANPPAAAPSAALEQIVVTATRRQERLQDTPIAITVMDAQSLAERGAGDIVDVARIAPNVSLTAGGNGSGGSFNGEAYIRGVGQNDWLITTDPGVGVYIDGVFLARATGSLLDLLDIRRVEVLRGPQGTLFGRNTVGGAISVTTARPTGVFGAHVEATLGQYNRREVKGFVDLEASGPIATRASFAYKKADGFVKRVLASDRLGGFDSLVGRLRSTWQINPTMELDVAIDGTRKRDNSVAQFTPRFQSSGNLYPLWKGVATPVVNTPAGSNVAAINAFLAATGSAGVSVNANDTGNATGTGPNISNADLYGAAATFTWDVSKELQFKSISAYRGFNAKFGRDGDNTPIQYIQTLQDVKQHQFSQELQLLGSALSNQLRWVGGLYLFNERATDENTVRLASGLYQGLEALPAAVIALAPNVTCPPPPGVPAPCAGGAGNPINAAFDLDFDIVNRIKTKSYAAFVHSTYAVDKQWQLVLGGRFTKDDKSYFLAHDRVNAGVPLIPATTVTRSDSNFSPKLGLNFRAAPDLLFYGSVGQGFKSGGFNGRPTTTAEVQSFGPEKVTSFELGAKTELLERRLRINAALFSNDYSDIQLSRVGADASNNLILLTENAGKARLRGAEVELQARPVEPWQIDLSLGYLDARFVSLAPGATVTLQTKLPRTPRLTAAAGTSYRIALGGSGGSGLQLTLRADASYRAKSFSNIENTPELAQAGFTLLSLRAMLGRQGGPWSATAFVTNANNKRYVTGGIQSLDSFGTTEAVLGRPREWGVTAAYSF